MREREFHDYVMGDMLCGIPGVRSRPLFGGYGIYKSGVFFALISDHELYFKADAGNRKYFEELGSGPFVYRRDGKSMTMSYWKVPEEVIENRAKLSLWVERSVAAALRDKNKKGERKEKGGKARGKK